jgi:hypothetical protein
VAPIPVGADIFFSLRQKVQIGTEAQPVSYSVGTGGSLGGRGRVVRLTTHRKTRVCLNGVYRDSVTLPSYSVPLD